MGGVFLDKRLTNLYTLQDQNGEPNFYILELQDHCSRLEYELLDAAEGLPEHIRILIEGYIETRDELEFHSVKAELRFGKRQVSG